MSIPLTERQKKYKQKNIAKWKIADPYLCYPSTEKECPGCHKMKPIREFNICRSNHSGLQPACSSCWKDRMNAIQEKHKNKWMDRDPYEEHLTGKKICSKCKIEKSIKEFNISKCRSDGLQHQCNACKQSAIRLRKYGISQPLSDTCDICGGKKVISIDHSHITGKVRGTLCRACNTALGLFRDNTVLLSKAIDYLKQ